MKELSGSFEAKEDDFIVISCDPLTESLQVTPSILPITSGAGTTPLADGSDDRESHEIAWQCPASGEYRLSLGLENIRESTGAVFFRFERDAKYNGFEEGDTVILGRHREVQGEDNWGSDMIDFLGKEAEITELSGTDMTGCYGVNVDIDDGRVVLADAGYDACEKSRRGG